MNKDESTLKNDLMQFMNIKTNFKKPNSRRRNNFWLWLFLGAENVLETPRVVTTSVGMLGARKTIQLIMKYVLD